MAAGTTSNRHGGEGSRLRALCAAGTEGGAESELPTHRGWHDEGAAGAKASVTSKLPAWTKA